MPLSLQASAVSLTVLYSQFLWYHENEFIFEQTIIKNKQKGDPNPRVNRSTNLR
jgi:hypothetical protein